MEPSSPHESKLRRAHPLAVDLIERLRARPGARVLELGTGSGRNTAALTAAGLSVHSIDDRRERVLREESIVRAGRARSFDAALSTHALLHGTPPAIAAALRALAQLLAIGAPLYATFGSKTDARYGKGTEIAQDAFAPDAGDEQGVPHAYFDETGLRELLAQHFTVESMEERAVDEIVGAWAHPGRPQGLVHWIVRAHCAQDSQ